MVGDGDHRTVLPGSEPTGGVCHETFDVGEVDNLAAHALCAVYEYFGGDEYAVYLHFASGGALAQFLLGGYVDGVALGGEVAEYVQFVVVVDDCHIPFGFGHAYGVVGDRRCHRRKRVGC